MKRGAGTHYPYVADGKGKGIIDDTSLYELAEIVIKTDTVFFKGNVITALAESE